MCCGWLRALLGKDEAVDVVGERSDGMQGLNGIGLKPSGIIAIIQAIKTAGALQGELIVQ